MSDFDLGYQEFWDGGECPEDASEEFEYGWRMAYEDSIGELILF